MSLYESSTNIIKFKVDGKGVDLEEKSEERESIHAA